MSVFLCMLIKPNQFSRREEIIETIQSYEGISVLTAKNYHLSRDEAAYFYVEHAQKPFFDDVIDYMSSGPITVLAVKADSVEHARDIVGNTDPKQAKSGTLRAKYGIVKSDNAVHCSDSVRAGKRELSIFYKPYDEVVLYAVPEEQIQENFYVYRYSLIDKLTTEKKEGIFGSGDNKDNFKKHCYEFLRELPLCENVKIIDNAKEESKEE